MELEKTYTNPEYIKYIKQNIKHAKDLYICVNCFDTKERRVKKEVKVDYTGFQIPDEFVVGYGLDVAEKYRNLPYIGYIEQ